MRYESVAFIGCSAKKAAVPRPAWLLYHGSRFRYGCSYADEQRVKAKFVLSARHGLVCMGQELEPYDESLEGKTPAELEAWAALVTRQFMGFMVREQGGIRPPFVMPRRVLMLADDLYTTPLRKYFPNAEYPLFGKDEEQQKTYLLAA